MAILQTITSGTHATITVLGTSTSQDLGLLINPSASDTVYIQTLVISNLLDGVAIRTNIDGTNGSVTIVRIVYEKIGGNVVTINRPDVNINELRGYTFDVDITLPYNEYHPHVVKLISTDYTGVNETPSNPILNVFIPILYSVNTSYTVTPIGIYGRSRFENIRIGETLFYIQTASPYLLRAYALVNSVIGGINNTVSVNNSTGSPSGGTNTGTLFSIVNHGFVGFISSNNSIVGFNQESMYTDYHEGFLYCPNVIGIDCVQGVTDVNNTIQIYMDSQGQPVLRSLPPVPLITDTPDDFSIKAEEHLLSWTSLLSDLKNYALWVSSRTFQNNVAFTIPQYSLGLQIPAINAGDAGKHLVVNQLETEISYEASAQTVSLNNFNNLI